MLVGLYCLLTSACNSVSSALPPIPPRAPSPCCQTSTALSRPSFRLLCRRITPSMFARWSERRRPRERAREGERENEAASELGGGNRKTNERNRMGGRGQAPISAADHAITLNCSESRMTIRRSRYNIRMMNVENRQQRRKKNTYFQSTVKVPEMKCTSCRPQATSELQPSWSAQPTNIPFLTYIIFKGALSRPLEI